MQQGLPPLQEIGQSAVEYNTTDLFKITLNAESGETLYQFLGNGSR